MGERTHTKHGTENTVYTVMHMGKERNSDKCTDAKVSISIVYGTEETKCDCLVAQLMALGIGQNGNAEL